MRLEFNPYATKYRCCIVDQQGLAGEDKRFRDQLSALQGCAYGSQSIRLKRIATEMMRGLSISFFDV